MVESSRWKLDTPCKQSHPWKLTWNLNKVLLEKVKDIYKPSIFGFQPLVYQSVPSTNHTPCHLAILRCQTHPKHLRFWQLHEETSAENDRSEKLVKPLGHRSNWMPRASWWFFTNPSEKICFLVKLDHLFRVKGWKRKKKILETCTCDHRHLERVK